MGLQAILSRWKVSCYLLGVASSRRSHSHDAKWLASCRNRLVLSNIDRFPHLKSPWASQATLQRWAQFPVRIDWWGWRRRWRYVSLLVHRDVQCTGPDLNCRLRLNHWQSLPNLRAWRTWHWRAIKRLVLNSSLPAAVQEPGRHKVRWSDQRGCQLARRRKVFVHKLRKQAWVHQKARELHRCKDWIHP